MISAIHSALAARRGAVTNQDDEGFTLIELLVVVIIIGILAAIAIPVYLGVQNNAKDSSVKSDIANYKTAIIAAETGHNLSFTSTDGGAGGDADQSNTFDDVTSLIGWIGAGADEPVSLSTAGTNNLTSEGKSDGATDGSNTAWLGMVEPGDFGSGSASLKFCIEGISTTGAVFYASDQSGVSTTSCTV